MPHAMTDFDFKNKKQINDLLDRVNSDQVTVELIRYFDGLKMHRFPFKLDKGDLEKILHWKLRTQYGRQRKHREKNTEDIIQKITETAFSITHRDKDIETEAKLKVLTVLKGVEIPVASAILTICFPNEFAVIDFRVWRQIFRQKKNSFTAKDYLKYINIIRSLAKKYKLTTQQIDLAIWQLDIDKNKL